MGRRASLASIALASSIALAPPLAPIARAASDPAALTDYVTDTKDMIARQRSLLRRVADVGAVEPQRAQPRVAAAVTGTLMQEGPSILTCLGMHMAQVQCLEGPAAAQQAADNRIGQLRRVAKPKNAKP